MPCPSPTYLGGASVDWPFVNWSARVRGQVRNYYEPASLAELVKVVADATQQRREIRVMGSLWAFEDIAYSPDVVVDPRRLDRPITDVLDTTLTSAWRDRQASQTGDTLFHVEAGIRIAALNEVLDLHQPSLAMRTLGGANGQTLAGAISTGTHGGDIDQPPLADMLMAMHVVTVGGKEIWIERDSDPITDQGALATLLTSRCPDTQVVRNDVLFDAALVSMGRFGILYSCVVRVRPAFMLYEWTTVQPWAVVESWLQAGLRDDSFLDPLLTHLPNPPPPPSPPNGRNVIDVAQPVGLEIVVNTVSPADCWVKRRWPVLPSTPDLGIDIKADALCVLGFDKFIGLVNASFLTLIATAAAGGLLNPIGSAIAVTAVTAGQVKFNADLAAIPNQNIGDILSLFFNTLWDLGLSSISGAVEKGAFESRYQVTTTTGKCGPAHIIKTGWPEESDQSCYRADSVEPAFDAMQPGYLAFMSTILASLGKYKQAGYISLRYSAASRALLAMHKVEGSHAVSIEVTSLRSLKDNATWMRFVEFASLGEGGRPHWGQMNAQTAYLCHETHDSLQAELKATFPPLLSIPIIAASGAWPIYGDDLGKWRSALAWISGSLSATFSSGFTRTRHLEPLATTPPLAMTSPLASMIAALAELAD